MLNNDQQNSIILLIAAIVLLLTTVILLSSCTTDGVASLPIWTTVPQERTTRASLPVESGGEKFIGAGVFPRKSSQDIIFSLPKETIKFMVTTCNREEFVAFPKGSTYTWRFIPLMWLENQDSCFATATAITKQGDMFKAIVDFRTGEDMPSTLYCNGQYIKATGAGVCQARAGLLQAITFESPVEYVHQEGCAEPTPFSNGLQFVMTKGFCSYMFINKTKQIMRLLTYGYTEIPLETP